MLEENSTISNSHYTVLEEIGELCFLGKKTEARNIISNLTLDIVPENYGFMVIIDNETIYLKNVLGEDFYSNPDKYDVLISSKRIISGEINRSTAWGPIRSEVRVWR